MDKMEQGSLSLGQKYEQKFPLPSRERVRMRGLCRFLTPSPHSSPLRQAQCDEPSRTTVKRKEVSRCIAGNRSTKVLLLSYALVILMILSLVLAGLMRPASAADGTRFLVSYGGTAGYQLPLWVNKEFGFSKKYGVDLEIILIQAGSPNIQALLGGSLQLTQTAASSSVIGAARGAPVVIVATL